VETGVVQNSEIIYVPWNFGAGVVRVPILDVTNPSFLLEDTEISRAALDAAYLKEEQRQSKRPRWMTQLMLKAGAHQSRFVHRLVYPSASYFDGLTTYLCKLGPDNLPPGFNTKLDQKVAATPHVLSIRLRLQHCVHLLADALTAPLQQVPARPLHLFNIAGGTAIDSLNALIVLRQRAPELLDRPIRIFVMDIDEVAPSFGALATSALTRLGRPLSRLDLEFLFQVYDWNDARPLAFKIAQSVKEEAIVALSSEGGLFEYGTDDAIVSNFRAMTGEGSAAPLVVGSVTSADSIRRASLQRQNFTLYPRTVEEFEKLARQAGFATTKVRNTPLSYQVLLERSDAVIPSMVE
jgi:hypothetical protein